MKPIIAASLLSCVPLFACATSEVYRADASLLVPWSAKAQRELPTPPYAARYADGDRALTFVASRHEHLSGCLTFEVVEREIELLDPQVIVIEGLTSDHGFSPEGYGEWASGMPEGDRWVGGEAAYAASRALALDIPFIGAEPSRLAVREQIEEGPFELRDLVYYVTVRQIPQWKRSGEDEGKTFAELFDRYIVQCGRAYDIGPGEFSDLDDFEQWYAEKNERGFDYDEIDTNVTAPIASDDALFTNRISARVGAIRDAHITGVIADMLNRYDRVLVVYGAGHHVQQARVLEDMLGGPRETQEAR